MQNYKMYLLYCLIIIIGNTISISLVNKHLLDNLSKKALEANSNKANFISSNLVRADSARKVSIAIFHPAKSPAVNAVIQGFKEELRKEPRLECSYTLYDNESNKNTVREQIEDALHNKEFDLFFTIGHLTSKEVARATRRRPTITPVVFAAVENPVDAKVVPQARNEGCFITGSSSEAIDHYEKGIALLLLLKPDIKRLLIPENSWPDSLYERKLDAIEKELYRHRIISQRIKVSSASDCVNVIKGFIREGDAILISRDTMIMAATADIVKLASKYNATVYALSIGAIAQGASFAFAADDGGSGINAGKKAREVLADGNHPAEVPITSAPCDRYLWINDQLLKSKKLAIDPAILFLLEHTRVAEGPVEKPVAAPAEIPLEEFKKRLEAELAKIPATRACKKYYRLRGQAAPSFS